MLRITLSFFFARFLVYSLNSALKCAIARKKNAQTMEWVHVFFTHTNVEMLSVFHTFYFSYDSSDKKTTARWNESATCGRHCWLWLLLDFMSIFCLRFWHSHTCTFTIWLKRFGNSISSQLAAGPLWYLCPR